MPKNFAPPKKFGSTPLLPKTVSLV